MTLVTAAGTGALGTLAIVAASTGRALRRVQQASVAAAIAVLAAVATGLGGDGVLVFAAILLGVAAALLYARCVRGAMLDSTAKLLDALERESAAKGRFLPRTLVERLGRDSIADVAIGDRGSGTMTILFADIRDSTALTESLAPNHAFALVSTFFARSATTVRKHHGTIETYLGDGFMALFPRTVEDALDAALDLHVAVRQLNRDGLGPEIEIGIGIHIGPVVFGTVGDGRSIDTTIVSDTVNTAKRVEGLSKRLRSPIVATGDVLQAVAVPARYIVRPLGAHTVRGKRDPIDVYAVGAGIEERVVLTDRPKAPAASE